jgi:hypothetical protein
MATDHQHHHSSHGDDGAGQLNHETTDISLDGVGRMTIGFAIILVIVSAVIYGSYRLLDRRATSLDTTVQRAMDNGRAAKAATTPDLMNRPNAIDEIGRPPAGPKLLTNERLWLAGVKVGQREALTSYAWVDKAAGTVRLPIERAKQLIVERGLPKTAAPADPSAATPSAATPDAAATPAAPPQ